VGGETVRCCDSGVPIALIGALLVMIEFGRQYCPELRFLLANQPTPVCLQIGQPGNARLMTAQEWVRFAKSKFGA